MKLTSREVALHARQRTPNTLALNLALALTLLNPAWQVQASPSSCSGFGFALLPGGPAPNTSVALGGEVAVQAVSADFNSDSIPDVASANVNSGNLFIALGTGTGTVEPAAVSLVDLPGDARATGLAVGDFNADGHADLVVSQLIVGATVFLGDGSGGFTQAGNVHYGTGANVMERVAVADFDGDGDLDIALTDAGRDRLRLAFGDGQGGLASSGTLLVSPDLDLTFDVAAGDVTGDGHVDLLTVGFFSRRLIVFAGDGTGAFSAVQSLPAVLDAAANPRSVTLADIDADGRLDALVASRVFRNNSGTPPSPFDSGLIYLGTSSGQLAAAQPVAVGNDPQSLIAADFDKDGHMDLAAANTAPSFRGMVARANASGGYEAPRLFPAAGSAMVLTADFDVDGFIDLAVLNAGGGGSQLPSLSIHINSCVAAPIFDNGFEAP
jgi:hypothetical protein